MRLTIARTTTAAIGLAGLLLFSAVASAWDGDWTQAVSGQGDVVDRPDSTEGKAGSDPPQKFNTPPLPEAVDVDPEELHDYFDRRNKDYAPYAVARITQTIRYNRLVIPKGYYLLKPGDPDDGSPRTNLATLGMPLSGDSLGALRNANPPQPGDPPPDPPHYRTLVIKRLGKVVGVVPIHRVERYRPRRQEHIPRQALAWLEMEDQHPVLKFYFKKRIYSTDFR